MEKWIHGRDWWDRNPKTKHILASTAKRIYNQYWDEYFKFSLVRNPWSRLVSLAKFPDFYGCEIINGKLDFSKYKEKNYPVEIDKRSTFEDSDLPQKPKPRAIYQNILNEELDFIGKYENLEEVLDLLGYRFKIPRKKFPHLQKSRKSTENYQQFYTSESREDVLDLHGSDIKKFKYKF